MWTVVDQNGDGVLDYGEFIRSFIGTMSEFRKQFVRKVKNLIFNIICKNDNIIYIRTFAVFFIR